MKGLRKNHHFRRNVERCGETHVRQSVGHDTALGTEISSHYTLCPKFDNDIFKPSKFLLIPNGSQLMQSPDSH